VLVHGSGPNDADETLGPNKIFADLALGLAARGVATLRYEKRTHARPRDFADATFTVEEETIADALAAVGVAEGAPGVDGRRVWLLGHSLGGFLAPRIAARAPKLAGVVILAGSTRPYADIVVDQWRTLRGPGSPELARAEACAATIRDPKLTPTTKVDDMGAVIPGSYFLDLRGYDAPATAARLPVPILVLQGGRDYQVTRADYEGWQHALGKRPKAKLVLYPDLNHLFEGGAGAPGPAEYARPEQHVAPPVVADVAAFVSAPPR
jgi:dienelactone hydrolase